MRSAQAKSMLVPKAAAIARIAEAPPFATVVNTTVPDFSLDLSERFAAAERSEAANASRDPLRHVAWAKAASSSSPGQAEFQSFDMSTEELEQENAAMNEGYQTPQPVMETL